MYDIILGLQVIIISDDIVWFDVKDPVYNAISRDIPW